jgi:D-alanine-D-alanine ligase-like ATP-grasp enzyme
MKQRRFDSRVLESFHPGLDLRILVIGYEVVAAAIRDRPRWSATASTACAR